FFWKSHPLRKHLIFLSFFRKKLKSEYSDYINAPLVLKHILNIKGPHSFFFAQAIQKKNFQR
ncbi:hypothetical protein, partial [Tetragenococcus halophilus]|uniref:hypothetical protein n=1 Tax=Tetragenococcus halophilus TaxID=51669 RepID=UPI001CA5EC13